MSPYNKINVEWKVYVSKTYHLFVIHFIMNVLYRQQKKWKKTNNTDTYRRTRTRTITPWYKEMTRDALQVHIGPVFMSSCIKKGNRSPRADILPLILRAPVLHPTPTAQTHSSCTHPPTSASQPFPIITSPHPITLYPFLTITEPLWISYITHTKWQMLGKNK